MKEQNFTTNTETQESFEETNSFRIEIEEYIEKKAHELNIRKEDLIEILDLDLESLNNKELDQKDIDFIKFDIEEDINELKELKEIGFSIIKLYIILKREGIVKTTQEFEKMCANENVRDVLRYAKEKNLKYAVNLYQIKTTQEFEKMCANENVRYILKCAKEENLKHVVNLYQIKTTQEFEKMCANENVRYILEYAKEKNLEYTIKNDMINKSNISKIGYESINSLNQTISMEQHNEQEISFLKKLFNQYSNTANNVLETISENGNIDIEKDYKDIFDMLDKFGNIFPIIFEKYKKFDSKERDIYVNEINENKKGMFKNNPIDMKRNFDEMAELIYIVYNPIGMSFNEVKKYLKELQDKTGDLARYKFPEDGYEINIVAPTEKVIRKGKEINFKNIEYVARIIKRSVEKNKEEDYNQKVSKVLDKITKASPSLDSNNLSYLISIIKNENISSLSEKHFDKNNINDLYNYLFETKGVLGIIFKDNFKEELENFLNENPEIKDRIIQTLQDKNKKEAFIKSIRKELKKDNKILTDEYWEDLDIEKISILLSTFVENKIIKTEREKISKELNKIIEKYQKEGTSRMKKEKIALKAYISKNIGSFFSKASAGICTADNMDLFNRKDHFHINLVEDIGKNNEIIRGNIQAYIIDDDKKNLFYCVE